MNNKPEDQIIEQIPCAQIRPNFTFGNDRQYFDPEALKELAASISKHGLSQPLTVRRNTLDGKEVLEIIAGERRFRAISEVLQWECAPCVIREMDDEVVAAVMLSENLDRADLLLMEEAISYKKRIDHFGWSRADCAAKVGRSQAYIKSRLDLLKIAEIYWPAINNSSLPIGHALELSRLDHDRQAVVMGAYARTGSVSLSDFTKLVRGIEAAESQASLFDLADFFVSEMERHSGALKGRNAVLNVPTDATMPAVQYTMSMTSGEVMAGYIDSLVKAGLKSEAAALGNLYTTLVRCCWMSKPGPKLTKEM